MGGNGPSSRDGSNPEEEEEEEEEEEDGGGVIPEYEKQRLSRIQENRARLEALGLPKLVSSLLGSVRKQRSAAGSKGKRKSTSKTNKKRNRDAAGGDDEYLPSEEDEQEGESSPPSEEDEEGDYKPSPGSNRKGKRKILTKAKVTKSSCGKEKTADINDIDDDVALQQAISLSLGQATGDLGSVLGQLSQGPGTSSADAPSRRKGKASTTETARGRNTRKENKSRVQLTDDEVVAYFFTFDGAGDGLIAFRDLQRMAATHDFIWTDIEIAHMIHFFDSDGDGKLSLNDFQTIVSRCNMLQEPSEC